MVGFKNFACLLLVFDNDGRKGAWFVYVRSGVLEHSVIIMQAVAARWDATGRYSLIQWLDLHVAVACSQPA